MVILAVLCLAACGSGSAESQSEETGGHPAVVVVVSGAATASRYTTPNHACREGLASGNTGNTLRESLLKACNDVYASPAKVGAGQIISTTGVSDRVLPHRACMTRPDVHSIFFSDGVSVPWSIGRTWDRAVMDADNVHYDILGGGSTPFSTRRGSQRSRRARSTRSAVRAPAPLSGDAWPLLVQLDVPVVVEQRGDHRRPDVLGGVEAAVVRLPGVHAGMVHEQQHTAGRDGREQRPFGRSVGGPQQGRVLRGDQVERRRLELCLRQARVHPMHHDTSVPGVPSRAREGHARHLQRGDVPTPACEPDSVSTLAAANGPAQDLSTA